MKSLKSLQYNRGAILILTLICMIAVQAPGQEIDDDESSGSLEDDLFGSSEDDIFGSSEDDLFGDSMIEEITEEETEGGEAYLEFLSSDEVQIGGSLRSSTSAFWSWQSLPDDPDVLGDEVTEGLLVDLGADVYLNARPSSDFRVFAKVKTTYPFTLPNDVLVPDDPMTPQIEKTAIIDTLDATIFEIYSETIGTLNATIFELYSDVNFNQQLFLRFGKQTVNWGVGYFWSPGDFISLVPIDPDDPEAEREGPVALKASVPIGIHELSAYVIADASVKALTDLGYAARGNFYIDLGDLGFETQLGFGFQKDRPFRIMSAIRLPLRNVNFFLEGRLSFGRQGGKILSVMETAEGEPTLEIEEDDETPYLSATAGLSFLPTNIFDTTIDLAIIAQYYFQGEGYENSDFLAPALREISSGAGSLHPSAVENFGMHYTALSISLRELFLEGLTISTVWQANWSDISGIFNTSISYRFFDGFSLSIAMINAYGDTQSEYGPANGILNRKNLFGKLAFSTTINIGGGQF